MHVLCLQVAIAAGDYPPSNLMQWWNSHKIFLLQWAATAKSILAVLPSSTAIQREFSIKFSWIHLTARTIITRLYLYEEPSVMFGT